MGNDDNNDHNNENDEDGDKENKITKLLGIVKYRRIVMKRTILIK